MEQKIIGTGVVALLVGFVLGNVTGNSGPDIKEIEAMMSERMAPASEAMDGMGASMKEQFAALSERLDALDEKATAAADSSGLDSLGAQIETLAGDLKSSIAAQSDAAAQSIAALGDRIGSAAQNATAEVNDAAAAAADAASDAAAEAAEIAETGVEAGSAEGLGAGATAILADGSVRAFVSRVTEDGARVSVNGELVTLAVGESTAAGDCSVTLDGIDGGKASLSAACTGEGDASGEDAAAAEAPAEGDAAAATEEAAPIEGGTGIGQTAMLGDGAVRVFVSGIGADGSSARIAVNGVETRTVAAGDSIETGEEGCTVTVDAIGAGSVALSYGCDS